MVQGYLVLKIEEHEPFHHNHSHLKKNTNFSEFDLNYSGDGSGMLLTIRVGNRFWVSHQLTTNAPSCSVPEPKTLFD